MAPTLYDKKPELGDLIEIDRGAYQHWAIYVGDDYVIHLAPPFEDPSGGVSSVMSVLNDKAVVKREPFWDVVGDYKYHINNLLDDETEPREVSTMLKEAQSLVGHELPYCIVRYNCEHFVMDMRYGKAESRQVRNAVNVTAGVGLAAAIGVGVLAAAAAFFGSSRKETKDKE